jgi:hypothetical protein
MQTHTEQRIWTGKEERREEEQAKQIAQDGKN